ncbi:MAG: hypothetical protein Q8878_04745 [Bacillota bacterium]|nr:hypothetical protein [Bacillota bacterium]
MAYYKELNARGAVTGILQFDGIPQDGGNYRYSEIDEAEYSALKTSMGAVKTSDSQIAELKSQLTETDYKIIKCSESSLVGLDLPYDIAALHAERQAIRDQINALESGAPV